MDVILIIELALNGALIGLMYALVALGIVLIYKTSGLANLAQGAMAMMGGYLTWAMASLVGAPVWIAVRSQAAGGNGSRTARRAARCVAKAWNEGANSRPG